MIPLPTEPTDNERQLAMWTRERITGLASATLTLANTPVQSLTGTSLELVVKNGAVLDPGAAYTIAGKVITLTVAAVGTDVFLVSYLYRS